MRLLVLGDGAAVVVHESAVARLVVLRSAETWNESVRLISGARQLRATLLIRWEPGARIIVLAAHIGSHVQVCKTSLEYI